MISIKVAHGGDTNAALFACYVDLITHRRAKRGQRAAVLFKGVFPFYVDGIFGNLEA